VVDVLVLAGIFASKSEVRRLIEGGGLTLDNEKVSSTSATLALARLKTEDGVLVRKGKKSYHTLKLAK
jgi:tyrosyl-tRNA synthetase